MRLDIRDSKTRGYLSNIVTFQITAAFVYVTTYIEAQFVKERHLSASD